MRQVLVLLILLLLIQCQHKKQRLQGHYVSIGQLEGDRYETLDINDSLILLNKTSVFYDQHDTVVINPEHHSFIRATRAMFPYYDFSLKGDTVLLMFSHDGGEDTVKYIPASKSIHDHFSTSLIEMDLPGWEGQKTIIVNELNTRNLVIGPLKEGVRWDTENNDSIFIECDNQTFLHSLAELRMLAKELSKDSTVITLCVHVDKKVSDQSIKEIRALLNEGAGNLKIVETRIKEDTTLVYIASENNPKQEQTVQSGVEKKR